MVASEKHRKVRVGRIGRNGRGNHDFCQHPSHWFRQRCGQTKYFSNSQLLSRLRWVLDGEWVVHERAGNRDGDGLNHRAFDPRIKLKVRTTT